MKKRIAKNKGMDIHAEVDSIEKQIRKHANTQRASENKEYLKSELEHVGLTMPEIRDLAKQWSDQHSDINLDELFSLAATLYKKDIHELRIFCIIILTHLSDRYDMSHMEFFEELVHKSDSWAYVDEIAVRLVGQTLINDRSAMLFLPIWSRSDNIWLRRTAILAQLLLFREGKGSMKMFRDVTVHQFNEPTDWTKDERFFIRKAIGWALRERSKAKPDSVVKYVNRFGKKMSGLTYKEATRNLPQAFVKKLKKQK